MTHASRRRSSFVGAPIVCVVFLVFLLLVPGCQRNKVAQAQIDCIANLRQLQGAKEAWAIENHKTTNDVPTVVDVAPFLHSFPSCRLGDAFTLGPVGEKPKCTMGGHELP